MGEWSGDRDDPVVGADVDDTTRGEFSKGLRRSSGSYELVFSSAILATLPNHTTYVTVMVLKGALRAFASFTTTYFVLEILTQIYVQGLKFFKHPGVIIDFLIIGVTVYSRSVPNSLIKPNHIHALFFLRYWRLVAIVVRIIANVEASHDATIAKLSESQVTTKKLQAKLRFMEDRRGDDAQHRSDVEALCVEYKNEIDTLMAALQLAAQDVAKGGAGGGMGRTIVDGAAAKWRLQTRAWLRSMLRLVMLLLLLTMCLLPQPLRNRYCGSFPMVNVASIC